MSAQQPLNVLGIGLHIPQSLDPQGDILKKVTAAATSKGLNLSFLVLDLHNKPLEECLAQARQKFGETKYAAIGIGNGVRGNVDMTESFEKLVNMAIEMQPGAKLSFPKLPTDVLDSFARVL